MLRDEDFRTVKLVGALETGGEVHAVPDDRVLHPFVGSDAAGDNFSRTDADTNFDRGQIAFRPFGV